MGGGGKEKGPGDGVGEEGEEACAHAPIFHFFFVSLLHYFILPSTVKTQLCGSNLDL